MQRLLAEANSVQSSEPSPIGGVYPGAGTKEAAGAASKRGGKAAIHPERGSIVADPKKSATRPSPAQACVTCCDRAI